MRATEPAKSLGKTAQAVGLGLTDIDRKCWYYLKKSDFEDRLHREEGGRLGKGRWDTGEGRLCGSRGVLACGYGRSAMLCAA